MKWTEQDLRQMLHRVRDKEWANSLVWLDRVESYPPQLLEGNICVLANERCLFCDGAIGSLQPSEVTVSVTVQVKSEIEMEGNGMGWVRGGGNPCIESSCRNSEGKSSFLWFSNIPSARPAISLILWITHLPRAAYNWAKLKIESFTFKMIIAMKVMLTFFEY